MLSVRKKKKSAVSLVRKRLICDVPGTFIFVLSWNMRVVNFSHGVLSSRIVGKKFSSKNRRLW